MSQRIRFANQLRGLAAVSVALSHLLGIYWAMPAVVSDYTFSPAQAGSLPPEVMFVFHPWFNFGPFGVGIFFLISGLVIPFSIEKSGRIAFAGARLLRIYPTYLAALLLELAVVYGSSLAWGRPFTPTRHMMVSNALLIYDVVGEPSIDLVNWTLSVELKFYLLAILLLPAIRAARVWPLLAVSAAILAVNAAMHLGLVGDIAAPSSTVSYTVSSHSVCLAYMLIGVAFNFHLRRALSTPGLLGVVSLLFLGFVGSWRLSVWSGQFPLVTVNYFYALALFATLYAMRRFVPENPVLDAMAAISFPFYLVHSLVGYTLLRALMVGLHLGYLPALAITLPGLLLVASALHVLVEKPTIRAGHVFSLLLTRLGQRPATIS